MYRRPGLTGQWGLSGCLSLSGIVVLFYTLVYCVLHFGLDVI